MRCDVVVSEFVACEFERDAMRQLLSTFVPNAAIPFLVAVARERPASVRPAAAIYLHRQALLSRYAMETSTALVGIKHSLPPFVEYTKPPAA